RWQPERADEGVGALTLRWVRPLAPSTVLRTVPLPTSGEDSDRKEFAMSFFGSLRAAFKGGAGKRAPLARSFVSPWSPYIVGAVKAAPFEYRGAVRRAFLENPVAQRAVRLVAEGVGGAPLSGEAAVVGLVNAASAGQSL